MRKYPIDHAGKQNFRRKSRRNRFWAGLASACIFAALFSIAAAGLSLVGDQYRVAGSVEHAVAENSTGHIVNVGSDNCSKTDFNNRNGRLSGHRYIPCPESRNINRDYQLPANRIESFSKGFAR